MKETDEETNASIKDVLLKNMLFKWRTESNEETTNEEENNFNERLVIRWLREKKKLNLKMPLLSRFVPKERVDPDLFFKELEKENVREMQYFNAFDTIANMIQDSSFDSLFFIFF